MPDLGSCPLQQSSGVGEHSALVEAQVDVICVDCDMAKGMLQSVRHAVNGRKGMRGIEDLIAVRINAQNRCPDLAIERLKLWRFPSQRLREGRMDFVSLYHFHARRF